ncbi:hypothetical protein DICPUDRAFT_153230 [Dictyostelium purpureum]|uniref:Succinate dehydrogenase assembly factor 4, mitochondrial n=1 Tax=Dictyostelium purpureum TaxID=5786 RepID=F0ZND3_DICPU|nr:uncharacterized protein DICPUDRAFT_153230 [Dictyostelium purpureum]EGC34541.1 hypothetical protein DICPUDRAFT_153230 [Dictyostelium purpureum]|eukprot:XP_003288917.1 hypothetical protein DICPUDRAFT_153230 [Dictyostelium purpureum]
MNQLIKFNNIRVLFLNSNKISTKCSYSTSNNNNSPFSKNSDKKIEISKENQKILEEIEAEVEEFDVAPYVNPKTGEVGGPRGPEPTRYNDWERAGRVSDF